MFETDSDTVHKKQFDNLYEDLSVNPYLSKSNISSKNKGLNTSKQNIIGSINEVLGNIKSTQSTVDTNLAQQFSVLGDFLKKPELLTALQKIDSNIIESIVKIHNNVETLTTTVNKLSQGGSGSSTNTSNITFADNIPTTGNYSVGDRIYRKTPVSNSNDGWICYQAGNPGEWVQFGTISRFGYSIVLVGDVSNYMTNNKLTQSATLPNNLLYPDFSKATNVNGFFKDCCNLTNSNLLNDAVYDLSNLDEVIDFYNNTAITTLPPILFKEGCDATRMFYDCKKLIDFSTLDTHNIGCFNETFAGCGNAANFAIATLDMTNARYIRGMFWAGKQSTYTCHVENITLNNLSSAAELGTSGTICGESGGYCFKVGTRINIYPKNVSNFMFGMRKDYAGYKIPDAVKNCDTSQIIIADEMFKDCKGFQIFDMNIDFSKIISAKGFFKKCDSLTTISLSSLDFSNMKSTESMFESCRRLTNIPKIITSDKLTNINNMFAYCEKLKTINPFNIKNVVHFNNAFARCASLESLDGFEFSDNIIEAAYMFNTCTSMKNFPKINTHSISNMSGMYNNCKITQMLDFDVASAENLSDLFCNCSSLTNVSFLNMSQAKNMSEMFLSCTLLTTISGLKTSTVTNMYGMFCNCSSLKIITELDTSNANNMQCIFSNCPSLTTIPKLDTSKATNMSAMFSTCASLKDIPSLDTSKVTDMTYMFCDCTSLPEEFPWAIDCSSLSTDGIAISNMFKNSSVKKVSFKNVKLSIKYLFTTANLGNQLTSITIVNTI